MSVGGDFRALAIDMSLRIEGSSCFPGGLSNCGDPSLWDLDEDATVNVELVKKLELQVAASIAPWLAHYCSLGMIRADQDGEPSFYLVYRAEDEDLAPSALAALADISVPLAGLPGATLIVTTQAGPIDAACVFETDWPRVEEPCRWGGQVTPEHFPIPGETCEEWLTRVTVPRGTIERTLERWRRSGGNLTAYQLCGAEGDGEDGSATIDYLIPGVLARRYVSLLLGPPQIGKTTLLGEIAAVVDSQCQAPPPISPRYPS